MLENNRIIMFFKKNKPYWLSVLIVILIFFLIASVLANIVLAKTETCLREDIVALKSKVVKLEGILHNVNSENTKLLISNDVLSNKIKNKEEIIKNLEGDILFMKNGIIQIIKRNIRTGNIKVEKECIIKPLSKVVKKPEKAKNKKLKKRRFTLNPFKWFSKENK